MSTPTFVERVRARFTGKRPWECWHCGWRDTLNDREVMAAIDAELAESAAERERAGLPR
jgi:hypothetical protein